MVTYHTDVFPFNILVGSLTEVETLKGMGFTDAEGNELQVNAGVSGVVIKAVRNRDDGEKMAYSLILFNGRPIINTIAHEAFHSACDLLENIGITYNRFEDNETYAYLMGYIAGCINDALNKDKVWE